VVNRANRVQAALGAQATLSVFEKNGWGCRASRERQGWNVEYGPDKNATAPSATPTDRELLLRSWYAKNVKPRP